MSLDLAKTRLLDNVQAYKQSLRNIAPNVPPDTGTSATKLPNDAARSAKAQRTREKRYGSDKHSAQGMKTHNSK